MDTFEYLFPWLFAPLAHAKIDLVNRVHPRYRPRDGTGVTRHSSASGVGAGVKCLDPWPSELKKANGFHLWDVEGHDYIDYCLLLGPLILSLGRPHVMKTIFFFKDPAPPEIFALPHHVAVPY